MPARPARHPLARTADSDPLATSGRRIPRRHGVPSAVGALDEVLGGPTGRRRPRRVADRADGSVPEPAIGAPGPSRAVASTSGFRDQDGSVATEYGLLAVVAATIVSVILEWATGGGITDLLAAVMDRVSELVGL